MSQRASCDIWLHVSRPECDLSVISLQGMNIVYCVFHEIIGYVDIGQTYIQVADGVTEPLWEVI